MTRFAVLARALVVAGAIGLLPQGIWSTLLLVNLRASPRVPWGIPAMILLLSVLGQYLNGRWPPASTSAARHRLLRASRVPRSVLVWTWLAGLLAVLALSSCWMVLASLTRMPGSVLPDLSGYPWWTAGLAVAMGAAISPLCEQAAFFGYWQVTLERELAPQAAIIVAALTFAVLPHPPFHAALWAKLPFFFLTGLTFSLMAYYSRSIIPGLGVHVVALLTFFLFVWPGDRTRQLVTDVGPTGWFWAHVAQTIGFAALAFYAFWRVRWTATSADGARRRRDESSPTRSRTRGVPHARQRSLSPASTTAGADAAVRINVM